MMLPKLLGGRKKKDRRPTDLKIPLPRLNGIHNADLTDAQITALLTKPASASLSHFNKDHFARTYKPKIVQQDDMLRGSANGPVLLMPKPGHPLPLAGRILRGEDHDKTQIESEHDGDHISEIEVSKDQEDHQNEETLLRSLEVKGNDINHDTDQVLNPPVSNVVNAQPAKMSGHTPSKSDHSDFRSTPKIPGHYPMSLGSSEKIGGLVERASYMSEMSSNESQQTFETARQSPFSHLSSVRSTPSMSVLTSANLLDSLDPSNILYDLSLHRHSAPESHAVSDIAKHLQQPIEKPESLDDDKHNAVAHHSQMESFPALLSPMVANLQSPTSSKGKSAGITSSSVTSPASSINTTKAVSSSAVTTPAQGSIKRINSVSSPPDNGITANSAADTNGHASLKPLAESSTESNQTVTPNSRLAETSAEIEALRKQMAAIQQERAEWKKREDEHRAREREMLEQISRTQEQLQLALTQAGFFSGSRRSKNPTPTSQTSSGIVNNDVDTISSGSNRLRRKKSTGSQSHSKSSQHSRSRSASREDGIIRVTNHGAADHLSAMEDGCMTIGETARLALMIAIMNGGHIVRISLVDIHPEIVVGVIMTMTRWIVSMKIVAGGIDGMQGVLIHPVEPSAEVGLVVFQGRRMLIIQLHRRHAEEPRSRKSSDARTWPSKHITIEAHLPDKQGPNGKVEPSPVVTPKSILRNGGTLSRQSSAGSTVRKNNGRVTKQNM
ncbi:hypothetical protein INT43_006891 [Umbelopsis isabellina]|uniref:Uncharacterized protein n=1 Tax=Mortierella isabellina TaxID=91625 RepID=A0A8H7PZG3_MORIS|nr:hypothetical protein INT43_006891 [Umbelopsis isabellina]